MPKVTTRGDRKLFSSPLLFLKIILRPSAIFIHFHSRRNPFTRFRRNILMGAFFIQKIDLS